ncbi:DUF6434 domain-containing protein [Pseudomonas sp. BJa3]|nr:DUF6434 domain-containing protein [Pseudomonas sp. BJa3]
MRRIQKIIQQRRRQLHVHLPPSELKALSRDDGPVTAKAAWLPERRQTTTSDARLQRTWPSKVVEMSFDWHAGPITRTTLLDKNYRNTQKVRQFLLGECGAAFKFDRTFMAWIKSGAPSTMGDVADEWMRTRR